MVVVVLFFFLTLQLSSLEAKDFDNHGVIYPIQEHDTIQLIQQKLKGMEERGELERHNRTLQERTKARIARPKPVEGITKTTQARVFTYDPTYIVYEDIKDHLGRIIHPKGTKINPFETVSLSQELVFIDGDDPEQCAWAQEKLQQYKEKGKEVKLILIKGAPLALSEELGVPVYFDQGGGLTKKLGIQHVPVCVSQEGTLLYVREVVLGGQS